MCSVFKLHRLVGEERFMSDRQIQHKLKNHDPEAMKYLYERYASEMLDVCRRYTKGQSEAMDIMHEGFFKVFENIEKYQNTGSLAGWIKRVMVNVAIDEYRKRSRKNEHHASYLNEFEKKHTGIEEEELIDVLRRGPSFDGIIMSDISTHELLESLDLIPEDYNVIFKLFVIEELGHKEIGKILNIDESHSRTRLSRSRDMIRTVLHHKALEKLKV